MNGGTPAVRRGQGSASAPDLPVEDGGETDYTVSQIRTVCFALLFLFQVYLFILRETETVQMGKGQRERENPKQAPCAQGRA